MTSQEIASIKDALETCGLVFNKFPKRIEVKIPKAKFPGVYLSFPIDGKSFKLQVYFQQVGIAFIEKLNIKGYTLTGDDMSKAFSLIEVKGMPSDEEIVDYIKKGLEEVVNIGIVRSTAVEAAI